MLDIKGYLLLGFLLFSFSTITSAQIQASKNEAVISVVDSSSGLKNIKTDLACTLTLMVDGPAGTLTIRNTSNIIAYGITAFFNDTALQDNVTSTTCDMTLPHEDCILSFTPGSNPVSATPFTIRGTNTTAITAVIQIGAKPVIAVTGPAQPARVVNVGGAPVDLVLTNGSPIIAATGITVDTSACPLLNANVTSCNSPSLAPGASCNISLTSNTPYVPCTITISGTNTANSPTALVAFSHLGGLVFSGNGVTGQVAISLGNFGTSWTFNGGTTNAVSTDDGLDNSNKIEISPSCFNNTLYCAVNICRTSPGDPSYYLPALNQLITIHNVLCSNNSIPCNFGNFTASNYWSSTEVDASDAYALNFPNGGAGIPTVKDFGVSSLPIRCVLDF